MTKTQGSSIERSTLGQNYQYARFINTPAEMGMKGSADSLGANINGITNYVDLLIYGTGSASKSSERALGDRYFMNIGGKCTTSDGSQVARSIYVDNVPSGNVKFLQEMGLNTSSIRGFIPALLGDIGKLNPEKIAAAFTEPHSPLCSNIYMNTVDENNKVGTGSGFVVNSEIKDISPSAFVSGKNLITGKSSKEPFINAMMGTNKINRKESIFKNKPTANIYTALVSGLLLYITYKFIYKNA